MSVFDSIGVMFSGDDNPLYFSEGVILLFKM